ncbi:mRNA binding protein puf3 [Scheffersomyces spartinae]|uniref:Pumilio homology domain family member 3 n=1 Tax=Scheffersomyces spartinae TaxID=45513 RepID=A0A9P7VBW7_9ASCO|nr:mRNA binding protein puf3 [Scheffersomyces spartinae]KAG7195188.1 mRNA binding protein puf3 [Scheffersomyces spartinae]
MPSETIWSNNTSPIQSHPGLASNATYKSVLDQVDPEVANLWATQSNSDRPLSLNDGSEIDNNLFGIKKTSLSAITAPVGNYLQNNQGLNFVGTASISGGIASRHQIPQESFLQKFALVTDATRDIELSNGLGKLSLDSQPQRRTSLGENKSSLKPFSPSGSLNENLNMPVRNSRNQSISEKIDSYNNSSPIQSTAALSIHSDLNSNNEPLVGNNIGNSQPGANRGKPAFWNPATATSFTPNMVGAPTGGYGYLMDNSGNMAFPMNFGPYRNGGQGIPPVSPPPFVMASPPLFIDPSLYNVVSFENSPKKSENDGELDNAVDEITPGISSSTSEEKVNDLSVKNHSPVINTPNGKNGIGLMSRQMPGGSASGYMFQPFNPYMYQQSPSPVAQMPPGSATPGIQSTPMMPPMFDGRPNTNAPSQTGNTSNERHQGGSAGSGNSTGNFGNRTGGGKRKNGLKSSKGPSHIYRSPLLEEIRNNTEGKDYCLKDIYGHAVEFTKDQHGSRFIQQKLPSASEEEKEVIFNEIRSISYDLMTDVFGNYVIQKYFEYGSTTQINILLDYMLGHIYDLSLQMYGCRVVQRALEAIEVDGQIKIIKELQDHVLVCTKDQNGNHVIQKSIERIPFDRIRFILDALDNHIYHLSTHPYGCRVIQRLLEFSDVEDQKKILDELNRFIFYLIQDQYGNYVMQHILERGSEEDREEILQVVLGGVVNFSKHKFASNVIEKCIKYCSLTQKKKILHEVMLNNEDLELDFVNDDSPLALMMKDQYANYVIQKLVEAFDTKSDEKKLLVLKLRQYLKQLSSKNGYGKHLASVEKMIFVAETALVEADTN